jgi:hypothetical protein
VNNSSISSHDLPDLRVQEPAVETDACGPLQRRDFWRGFKWYMEANSCVNCARVTTDGWMWHNTDLTTGNLLSFVRARLGDVGVKYTLNDSNASAVYEFVFAHRAQVEAAFDHPLEWRSGDGLGIIEVRHPMGSFDKAAWPAHFEWFQRQLETFRLTLLPLVGRIPPKRETASWDEGLFLRELEVWNPGSLVPAQRVLQWTAYPGAGATWGRGRTCGSFAVTVPKIGVNYQPVSLRTDGLFSVLFTQLKRTPIFESRTSRLAVLERLNTVPGLYLGEEVVESRPSLPLAMLAEGDACDAFLSFLDWFKETVRTGRVS